MKECASGRHIVLDFYSPQCRYCYEFMPEFNRVYDFMMEKYGNEQIVIFKVNGWESPQISQAFGIPYYPFFLYVAPNTPNC
jgi:thiol-disulfide isomerase/thioredoxin